eukprot:TRINITY_DN63364_c0_g1_i1.p1 TRINITY_DN63364_c0_g1~~TRINITY_DN63364_c0_g1_i1.p1  ORF type:complete len:353 (-),score=63.35 TRINITY_DN63364_c0_g1_i1:109-1167(-)
MDRRAPLRRRRRVVLPCLAVIATVGFLRSVVSTDGWLRLRSLFWLKAGPRSARTAVAASDISAQSLETQIGESTAPALEVASMSAADVVQYEPLEALSADLLQKVRPKLASWDAIAMEGRTITGYGAKATLLLNRTMISFDEQARGLACDDGTRGRNRGALQKELGRTLHSIFLVQRSSIEEALYQRLKRDLLRRVRKKHRELPVKEKLKLLHEAMQEYDMQVRELQPEFVENPERDRAEQRLSKLQWAIMDTPEGKEIQQKWQMEKLRRNPTKQSRDVSVSFSPGMRLLLRPGGFGNFQLSSKRQVGPPHNPSEVSIGVLNDGSIIDVYRDKPKPPLVKFQPTVGIDLKIG